MVAAHPTDPSSTVFKMRVSTADARAVHRVRRTLATALDGRTAASMSIAELVLGELMGNATRHAAGVVDLRLELRADVVAISVTDRGPGFDLTETPEPDPFAESGRGLAIVRACSRSLEVARLPGAGCRVTAVVPISA